MHRARALPFALFAIAAPVVAQGGWVQRLPAHSPPARAWHGFGFDAWRGVHVMFGGADVGGFPYGDTWEWDGMDWVQSTPGNSPPARQAHAMAYDFTRGRVVVFGGRLLTGVVGDTWEFDGVDWVQRSPTLSPPARQLGGMAYSSVRGRAIVFGGALGSLLQPLQDTWEWDGTNWSQLTTATAPSPRFTFPMTSDFASGRVILVGGFDNTTVLSDAWAFDGVVWALLPAAQSPSPRTNSALVADLSRGMLVQFGGMTFASFQTVTNETWLHDGSDWRRDARPTSMPPRRAGAFSYDWPRDRAVLFGGADANGYYLSETWEYSLAGVALWSVAGAGCAGTHGVPQLRPPGSVRAFVGTTYWLVVSGGVTGGALFGLGFSDTNWNGNALPLSLAGYGMPGCALHTSLDVVAFATGIGGAALLALAMPNDPGLVGVRFLAQALVPQPGVNPLGAVTSNAVVSVVGSF